MLQSSFKSAGELGLCDIERNALIETLRQMESGEIPQRQIRMASFVSENECGTTHCIAGWAHEIDKRAFPEVNGTASLGLRLDGQCCGNLISLFGMMNLSGGFKPEGKAAFMCNASPETAISKLRQYLETGDFDMSY